MNIKNFFVRYRIIPFLIIMVLLSQCDSTWEKHYLDQDERVNEKLWDAIKADPKYSAFSSYMESTGLDSIFDKNLFYTLFIPPNESFSTIPDTGNYMETVLRYHISPTIFLDRDVNDKRRLQTILGKFSLIENEGSYYTYDGVSIGFCSPLYLDGKYYELEEIVLPKPNLYEYISSVSKVIKNYIDSQDSISLDLNLSTPIGFDKYGNTIYDSVFAYINLFEQKYFRVSQEFRNKLATLVIITQDQYDFALDNMAARLGGVFHDHNNIPEVWQRNVLLPDIIKRAMFDGDKTYNDLLSGKLQSITGDTVIIDGFRINPESKFICSNGVAYSYRNYFIKDSLFRGVSTMEGENLIDSLGQNKFVFKNEVKIEGAVVQPEKLYASAASGGAIVNVNLGRNYKGNYTLEFTFKDLFPMLYRLEWRANSRPSGIFRVYVNDVLLTYNNKFGTILTEFDTYNLQSSITSVTGELFLSKDGYNKKDYWIENLVNYGDVRIKFEYIGSGSSATNGLNIDYVKLIPKI